MNLLLFSDLHNNAEATRRIVTLAPRFDVLVGAGDFGNQRRDLLPCIDLLRQIDKPTILVAGNSESNEELRAACRGWKAAQVLHGESASVAGVTFFGVGGGIPVTPFGDWSYDFTEEQARALLANCPEGCVLVTHSPPKGVVDVSSTGSSRGSVAIRKTVERTRPILVVCGHIHASAGQKGFVGESPVINAGPHGAEWRLDVAA